jgi:hypothetical protein
MRCIAASTWAEIRTAYASGVGLAKARNMNTPVETVPARSKRQGWTLQMALGKS